MVPPLSRAAGASRAETFFMAADLVLWGFGCDDLAQAGRAATESLGTYNMGLGCLRACREGL